MKAELKPCPFCGETPTSRCPTPGTLQNVHRAVCMTKGCALYLCHMPADKWNTRPTPADCAKLEAFLAKCRTLDAALEAGGLALSFAGQEFHEALAALEAKEQGNAERIRAAEGAALDMIPEALSEAQYDYEGKPFCSGCHRAWDGEHKGNCGFGMLKTAYANLQAARGA